MDSTVIGLVELPTSIDSSTGLMGTSCASRVAAITMETEGRVTVQIFGKPIDEQTRCVHYGTQADVVAIEFACCRRFYPCHLCHEETADHPARQWSRGSRGEKAILCGVCQ